MELVLRFPTTHPNVEVNGHMISFIIITASMLLNHYSILPILKKSYLIVLVQEHLQVNNIILRTPQGITV